MSLAKTNSDHFWEGYLKLGQKIVTTTDQSQGWEEECLCGCVRVFYLDSAYGYCQIMSYYHINVQTLRGKYLSHSGVGLKKLVSLWNVSSV